MKFSKTVAAIALFVTTFFLIFFAANQANAQVTGVNRGGTGIGTAPSYGQVLLGNSSGGYTLTSTSSLGIQSGSTITASYPLQLAGSILSLLFGTTTQNTWTHQIFTSLFATNATTTNATTTSLGINGETFRDLTGTGLQNVGGALTLNATGDWTGTFDGQEGTYYLANSFSTTSADYWKTQRDLFSTTSAIYFAHSSTTIPKTYTSNTFLAANTFNGGLTIGSLTGPLVGLNGVVSASSTLSVNVGGTGSTTLSGLILGNGTGPVLTTTISAPLSLTGSTLAISQAGSGTNGYLSSTDWTFFNQKIGSTSLSASYPLSYNSSTGGFTTAFGTTTQNNFNAHNTFTSAYITSASSTNATSTNLAVTNLLTFNGVTGSTWASFCTAITGGASLCDGADATAASGLATTTPISSGNLMVYTSAGGGAAIGVGTTTLSVSGPFTIANPIGVLTNGAVTYTGLATTSQPSSSQLLVSNGGSGVYGASTSTPSFGLGLTVGGTWSTLGSSPTLNIATSSLYTGSANQIPYFTTTNTLGATSTLSANVGGTGSTTALGGILAGNGWGAIKSAVIGTGLSWDGTTLTSTLTGGTGLSTTSPVSAGNLLVYSSAGAGAAFGVATSSETCTAPLSCTAHTVLTGGGAITIGNASAGVTGALTGTDWTTFNDKIGWGQATSTSANQIVYTNNLGKLVSVASSSLSLPNTALQNSSITINSSAVSLGGSITVASTTLLGDSNTFSGTLNRFTSASTSNATTSVTQYFSPAVVAASSLLRVDSTGKLSAVTIGSNISFDGTTLSATGGSGAGLGTTTADYIIATTTANTVTALKTSTNTVVSTNASADVVLRAVIADATSTTPYKTHIYFKPGYYYFSATSTFGGAGVDNAPMWRLWGAGVGSTNLVAVGNASVFHFSDFARADVGYMTFYNSDNGHAISSKGLTTDVRSVWNSHFHDLLIVSTSTTSGVGMLMGNAFRNTYDNINFLALTGGCIRDYAEGTAFFTGDSVYNNMMCDLSSVTGSAPAYEFTAPAGGQVNQSVFNEVNGFSDAGTHTQFKLTNTNWMTFKGINSEGFSTTTDILSGTGNTFEFNYITVNTSGNYFGFSSTAYNNSIGCRYVDNPTGAHRLLLDGNTITGQANTLQGVSGANCVIQGAGTFTFSTTSASVVRDIYDNVGSITYLSGIKISADKLWFDISSTANTYLQYVGSALKIVAGGNTFASFTSTVATLTQNWDFTSATGLKLPNGSAPTVDATGEIAVDTTSDQLDYYGASTKNVLVPFHVIRISMASSTWGTGTTTLYIGPASAAQTFQLVSCETSAGTLQVSLYDGTNRSNFINASTTINLNTLSINNTFTAGETIRIDVGSAASSPTAVGCSFRYTYDSN